MERMSILPRWMHCFYAWVARYAWGPCPLCNRSFGGHEWKDRNGLSSTITTKVRGSGGRAGKGICPSCTRAGFGDPSWVHPR